MDDYIAQLSNSQHQQQPPQPQPPAPAAPPASLLLSSASLPSSSAQSPAPEHKAADDAAAAAAAAAAGGGGSSGPAAAAGSDQYWEIDVGSQRLKEDADDSGDDRQQQQQRLVVHEEDEEEADISPPGGAALHSHRAVAAASGDAEDDEWARGVEEDDYGDAVLRAASDSTKSSTTSPSSGFTYAALTSYIPASLSSLPSSLSSLPSSLSSLPSSLSSLPSSIQQLSLSSLPSLPSLTSLPTTTASSSSSSAAPVVISYKAITSFSYHSQSYHMLIVASSSSLLLYWLDPSPSPSASSISSPSLSPFTVRRVSHCQDAALSSLSSACFLTPSVNNLASPDLLLPSPLTPPSNVGPLLALTSSSASSPSFPSSSVRIFSTFLCKTVHVLRFRSRVLSVLASASAFAVLLDGEIHLYRTPLSSSIDGLRFDFLYSLRCAAGDGPDGVCALGPRWIAYASEGGAAARAGDDSPLLMATTTSPNLASGPGSAAGGGGGFSLPASASSASSASSTHAAALLSSLPSSSDSLSTISRNIASSLYNLGDQGRKSISSYLAPLPAESSSAGSSASASMQPLLSPSAAASASSAAAASAASSSSGTVIVRDLLTQRVLCHLKAHSSAIAALAFDPSGTLLVTAGQHGQYIHIYQVVPLPPPSSPTSFPSPSSSAAASAISASSSSSPPFTPRFLYRLFRGVTHATLRSLSFSSDSQWFSCSSHKGTTHIFAINPQGGSINIAAHAPPFTATSPLLLSSSASTSSSSSSPQPGHEEEDVSGHPLTLNAIHRIRANFPSSPLIPPVVSSFLHLLPSVSPAAPHIDHLALLTSTAEVIVYALSTSYRNEEQSGGVVSAVMHRGRKKETVVGGSDSIGKVLGSAMEEVGVVVGNVVHEAAKAVKNYQQGAGAAAGSAAAGGGPDGAAGGAGGGDGAELSDRDRERKQKLDLHVKPVAHVHLESDVLDATAGSGGAGGRRGGKDDDGGGGGGGGGPGKDRRVIFNPSFFQDIELQRHAQLTRSAASGSSSPSSSSSSSSSTWLSNVELRTHCTTELPLWASPQFTLYTYTQPASAHDWYTDAASLPLAYDKYTAFSSVRVFDARDGYCFPELDTRVLTNWGLLFLDQVETLQQQGDELLFGCYEEQTQLLLYSKGSIVFPERPPPYLVDFTSPGEDARWASGSGDYGTEEVADDNSHSRHISLRVTPDHEMYVQLGNRAPCCGMVHWSSTRGGKDPATGKQPPAVRKPHSKVQAQHLLSADAGAYVRMLACAQAGYAPQATSQRRTVQHDDLHLDDTQFAAFLELLGFWLGDGSLDYNPAATCGCVTFSLVKQTDLTWLRSAFKKAGLKEDEHWLTGSSVAPPTTLYITKPAWFAFFDAEFGGKSAKHLPDWTLQELPAADMRLLISGLHRAHGSCAGAMKEIHTSSAGFRDQLVPALLHCGYSASAALMHRKGVIRGYNVHDQCSDTRTYSLSFFAGLSAKEQLKYRPITATADSWKVSWAELDHVRSDPAAGSCWPSLSRQQCVTRVPYDAERDGRSWCVKVEHDDHLIIAQRAHRGPDGAVTKQSRPIVVGNCQVKLEEEQVEDERSLAAAAAAAATAVQYHHASTSTSDGMDGGLLSALTGGMGGGGKGSREQPRDEEEKADRGAAASASHRWVVSRNGYSPSLSGSSHRSLSPQFGSETEEHSALI